jgi:adenine-specific DNA-methyltransferase
VAVEHSGRLELTWTNKHLRLLSNEDGGYTWVPPADYRVAEVRLLHDVEEVGETHAQRSRAKDNLLIAGDALNALTSLCELPELAREYVGKVKLAYLDPPFNTQQAFEHYDDALEHSVWLTMMRDRLLQIRKLLAPDGSVWVHCDDSEQAYLKVMMDEVFGRDNFVAVVIWEKTDSPRMDAKLFSGRHDYILVFRRSDELRVLNQLAASDAGEHYNKIDEDGRRYYIQPLRARGGQGSTREARPTLYYPLTAPDGTQVYPKLPDGRDGAWRWSRERVERESHLIHWIHGKNGYTAWFRKYEPAERFRPPETIWPHREVGSTRTSSYEIKNLLDGRAFATPKPERLMQRIVHIASNPGDVVLDCFAGSGTTAAVAHKMGRRWIAVERSRETVETFAKPRLEQVVAGADPGGITEDAGWEGGGGFRVLEVGPSMFAEVEGRVWLALWAADGELAEATAAQLGYEFEPDPPFAGRRGRTRLAVIDGLVNADVVELLVSSLEPQERLVVCGTAIDPEASDRLRELRSGSRTRKIPASILAEYRIAREWRDAPTSDSAAVTGGEVVA